MANNQLPFGAQVSSAPTAAPQSSSDWQEHTASNGRRYYYNRKTKQSSWEKPPELMTPIERVDASTDWKEIRTPDGKKYYYNKVTKQSRWTIPEELQLAREKAEKEAGHDTQLHAANTDTLATNQETHGTAHLHLTGFIDRRLRPRSPRQRTNQETHGIQRRYLGCICWTEFVTN